MHLPAMKRTPAQTAAQHWAKRAKTAESIPPREPAAPDLQPDTDYSSAEIVDVASESEPEPECERERALPFELLETSALGVPKDGVSLEELVPPDLTATFQFNFSVDVAFFLAHLPDCDVTFVTGADLSDQRAERPFRSLRAPLADRFGSHHTKMMVNFFATEVEVVILTANLTMLDFGGLTQMCWRSGRLPLGRSRGQGAVFQRDFVHYLRRYRLKEVSALAQTLARYDFSAVDVELFALVPGTFDLAEVTTDSETYGYGKFHQLLRRNHQPVPEGTTNVLAQVSSIAAPYKSRGGETALVFSHIICPIVAAAPEAPRLLEAGAEPFRQLQRRHRLSPLIVYPSVADMSRCCVGWGGGQLSHFNYTSSAPARAQFAQNIEPYLCRWHSALRGRAPAHVKMYLCDNADAWGSLRWAVMASHNLSKQAWGYPTKDTLFKVASYELGVFVSGRGRRLVPSRDVLVPFDLPPRRYAATDRPWSYRVPTNTRDIYGRVYHPE